MSEPAARGRPTGSGELEIRRATVDDVDALARLGVDTYREHFADIWSASARERWLAEQFAPARLAEELSGEAYRYDLASVDGGAVGYAKTLRASVPPVPASAVRGFELQKIYFLRNATGRGYGTALIERLCDVGRALGEPHAWLKVLKSNTAAERLYRRLGFEVVGDIPLVTDLREIGMWVLKRDH